MKRFSKKVEDFICQQCSTNVQGNGFTNHCPVCFYSKHVDINPGDRMAECGGLMKPINYQDTAKKGVVISHQCLRCGVVKNNKMAPADDLQSLIHLVKQKFL